MKTLANVSAIVVGVAIASYGEIKFDWTGFLVQAFGIVCEATRLVMVQRLLSSAEFKMDPMVSLYYYAPACAVINGVITLFVEIPKMTMTDIYDLGMITLVMNAFIAFLLNVAVVLLVSLVLASQHHEADPVTDRQDLSGSLDTIRRSQRYSLSHGIYGDLRRPSNPNAVFRLLYRTWRPHVLQAWGRKDAAARHTDPSGHRRLPAAESGQSQSDFDLRCTWNTCFGGVVLVAKGLSLSTDSRTCQRLHARKICT